jgi:hypothetical protein
MASENVARDAEIVPDVSPVGNVSCLEVRWNGGAYPLACPKGSHTERGQREEHILCVQRVAVWTNDWLSVRDTF